LIPLTKEENKLHIRLIWRQSLPKPEDDNSQSSETEQDHDANDESDKVGGDADDDSGDLDSGEKTARHDNNLSQVHLNGAGGDGDNASSAPPQLDAESLCLDDPTPVVGGSETSVRLGTSDSGKESCFNDDANMKPPVASDLISQVDAHAENQVGVSKRTREDLSSDELQAEERSSPIFFNLVIQLLTFGCHCLCL
jgi:hypothetical protein